MPAAPMGTRLALALALMIPLLLPRQVRAQDTPNSITLPPNADHVTIPLARHYDTPTVSVTIAGQDAGRFLIDTSSPGTIIDTKLAQRLKLPATAPDTRAGAPQPPLVAELRHVSLAGVPAGSHFALVRELKDLAPGITGIVGTSLLRDTPFTLDLQTPSLTFYRPGHVPAEIRSRGAATPLTLLDGRPVVRAAIDGRPGHFALDTGTTGLALTVVDSFALRDQDMRPRRRLGPDAPPASGRARFDHLDLPGRSLDRVWAALVERDNPSGRRLPSGCVGMLGPRALLASRWTFDFAAEIAWVEWPAPEDAEAYVRRLRAEEESGTTLPPLLRALDDRRPDAVKLLLEHGADPNAPAASGGTALARAADAPEILRLLLAHKADVHAVGPDGRPALLAAAEAGNVESVRLLLAAGAKVDADTPTGFTALHRAAEADDADVLEALLDARANPDAAANDGTTPLILAAYNGSTRVVTALLKRKVNVRAATELGYTALHAAALAHSPAVARLLLDAGADPGAPAKSDGATPLSVAALEDDPECARLLVGAGANPAVRLADGSTPLSIAVAHGHTRCVEALRATAPAAIRIPATQPSATVPLAWCNDAPCARVTIAGQEAGWFLIDLRRPGIVVDTKLARRLNLPRLGSARPTIDPTDAPTELFDAPDLAIEGLSAGPRVVMTADLASLPGSAGKITGILGWPALLDQPCTLDLRAPSLTAYRPGALPASATATALPLRARYLPVGPAVWARAHDETGWFRLDARVASGDLLEVTHAFATARADLFLPAHLRNSVYLRGGRPVERPLARLDTLSLAGQRISPAPAAIAPPSKAPWRTTLDGVLSLPSRDLRLTLDPQAGKAWLDWLPTEPLDAYLARVERSSSTGPAPESPLVRAVTDGRLPAVTTLLQRAADPNAPSPAGLTPLMLAADRPAAVDALLTAHADPNAAAAFLGTTALLRAVEAGNSASVRLLLSAGAKVDQPNTLGQTALFRAAEADYPEIVDLLVKSGADPNAPSKEGWTPLTIAASRGSAAAVTALLRAGAGPNRPAAGQTTALCIAAFKGDVAVTNALIAGGADLHQANGAGLTPLMAAAASNQTAVLRLLLSGGAKPDATVANHTAYDLAASQTNLDAMTVLRFESAAARD